MPLRRSSSVTSPGPMILMPALSRPRSTNCLMKTPPWPDGTNTKIASGFWSAARCRNGAVILDEELDFLAGDRIALLRHEEFHRRRNLFAGRLLLARHRQDEADLDAVLRLGAACGR